MQIILVQPCKCSSLPLKSYDFVHKPLENSSFPKCPARPLSRSWVFSKSFPILRSAHVALCSRNDVVDGFSSTSRLSDDPEANSATENRELGLLDKPFPIPRDDSEGENGGSGSELVDEKARQDEALAPFLKFFNTADGVEEEARGREFESYEGKSMADDEEEDERRVGIEYYEPKPGDFVVGVVVSGNENKLDVNVGADFLGTMLTKEVLPLYDKEMESLLCDPSSDAEEFYVPGKMGVIEYEEAVSGGTSAGKPVVEPGTVLFAEVLGRTLSGRPLLSTRRLFRRIAWHRVRQISQLNEPVEVRITEWNTGGLLTRIEGLRAFVPKAELLNRVRNFSELKEKTTSYPVSASTNGGLVSPLEPVCHVFLSFEVGSRMRVLITRINEEKNDLILSEKEAWQMSNLRIGALLEGTVRKIFPFGAQIRLGETNRSGLLHISNISKGDITSVSDLLSVDEKVKVLVVKSLFPDKISLSIADLESEPGLFLSNKERLFSEAEMMAKKYREKLPVSKATGRSKYASESTVPFENEAETYANWKWFKFESNPSQTEP